MSLKYGLPLVFASVGTYLATSYFQEPEVSETGIEGDISMPSAPSYEAPSVGAPSYEAPKFGAPSYEAPTFGAPSYETPKFGAPSYEAPKFGAPSYEAPKFGAPSYQAPSVGAPSYEAPKFGAPSYQAPSVGAPAYQAPTVGAPAYQAPTVGAPAYEAPSVGAPAYQAPITEKSTQPPLVFPAVPTTTPTILPPSITPEQDIETEEEEATGPDVISPEAEEDAIITPYTAPAEGVVPPETGPVEGVVPTETGPVEGVVPPETGPVEGVVPTETGSVEGVVPPETGPTEEVVPPETRPVEGVVPPETGPVEGVVPTETGPVEGVVPPETGPTEEVVPPETRPVEGVVPPETGPAEEVVPSLQPEGRSIQDMDILPPLTEQDTSLRETKKKCDKDADISDEETALPPIDIRLPDEVHKKSCEQQPPVVVGRVEVPDVVYPQTAKPISVQPENTFALAHLYKPNSISVSRGVMPTNDKDKPYSIIHGEPQQGPVAEATDPSELYRRTRANLRKTRRVGLGRARRYSNVL